jgi:hypothetical protein
MDAHIISIKVLKNQGNRAPNIVHVIFIIIGAFTVCNLAIGCMYIIYYLKENIANNHKHAKTNAVVPKGRISNSCTVDYQTVYSWPLKRHQVSILLILHHHQSN